VLRRLCHDVQDEGERKRKVPSASKVQKQSEIYSVLWKGVLYMHICKLRYKTKKIKRGK